MRFVRNIAACLALWAAGLTGRILAQVASDGQRLAAHSQRIVDALESIGSPIDEPRLKRLLRAQRDEDVVALQTILDEIAVCSVMINPESRVKVEPMNARDLRVQQAGYIPWVIKVINQGNVKSALRVSSPHAGPSYAGVAPLSMQRQDQLGLRENEITADSPRRFLHFEWLRQPPLTDQLSGALTEYQILLVYCAEAGTRETTLEFSVGSGTQDLGFRAQLPIVFDASPAVAVPLSIRDEANQPAFARLTIRDALGNVYPPQPKRLAPDLFFQQQIYREDGETVLLPPGQFEVACSQGPETLVETKIQKVSIHQENRWEFVIHRWVRPMEYGWYCGDHHIHGAGCAHYTAPSEGVTPKDMFRQVAGEGLNVGCILTWGPCFEYQRQFFRPTIDDVSRPKTLLKYDVEVSGFGSQALGHVCLLNLRDQNYPGSDGTKEKGWPTWASPVLKWAKEQGGVTGFAHSASGLQIAPDRASERMMQKYDANHSGLISRMESKNALLPNRFELIDSDGDGGLSRVELHTAIDTAADQLPNLAIPEMNSVGAMELPVAVTAGVCDFISTMDTARIAEWNMWYHILNCGFPLKASGETDFPCMSGNAVGQGRVYVQLGDVDHVDFAKWCQGIAAGKSYVSDGYAHALEMRLECEDNLNRQISPGDQLNVRGRKPIQVIAKIALAAQMPRSVAYATKTPEGGRRFVGDTVTLHGPRHNDWVPTGERIVELVVNGRVAARQTLKPEQSEQTVQFHTTIERSSWVALRIFPHLHTNPIEVLVDDRPIRASSESALWCIETIEQLWQQREKGIAAHEWMDAKRAFDRAIDTYRQIAIDAQSP